MQCGPESANAMGMQISPRFITALGVAFALTLSACGGFDADDTTEPVTTAAESADEVADDTASE
ncbi:MAG: hypothetical protein ACJAXA_002356 [Candidatus Aldehydirespiratoraceae bacterium]|jgi:hypothetical protein